MSQDPSYGGRPGPAGAARQGNGPAVAAVVLVVAATGDGGASGLTGG